MVCSHDFVLGSIARFNFGVIEARCGVKDDVMNRIEKEYFDSLVKDGR